MAANESARQAGSNDTIPDPWLTTDGLMVNLELLSLEGRLTIAYRWVQLEQFQIHTCEK